MTVHGRWIHITGKSPAQYVAAREHGVSKKERRRRKDALIDAIDGNQISADAALKALQEEMIVDPSTEDEGTSGLPAVHRETES